MEQNEEQLVRLCKQQLPYDTTAFAVLLRRYEPVVFRTCRRYLGHEQEAEDACQDAFLRVFHGLARFEERSSFRTWLFRVVANVCATRWSQWQKRAEALDAFREEAEAAAAGEHEPAEGHFAEVTGVIGDALESLSADDRQVLVLRHVAELSFSELAGALELGLSAAKMRLYRAEQRLRSAYESAQKKQDK